MSEEYLWDRSGLPESDELELEALLRPLGLRTTGRADWVPPAVALWPARRVAFGVLAAAACVVVGFWLGARQLNEQAIVADGRVPAQSEPLPPGVDPEPAGPAGPAGTARSHDEVVDPWGNERPSAARARLRPGQARPSPADAPNGRGIVDPWGRRPAVEYEIGPPRSPAPAPRDEVVDPWKPRSKASASENGAGLTPAAIQRVASDNRSTLATACWQPAVAGSAADAPGTARVGVKLVIGPDGRVRSASHDGEPAGYPGLAQCVVGEMLRWRFPAGDGQTAVSLPIVFSRP